MAALEELRWRTLSHAGEVLLVFTAPAQQLFLSPAQARALALALVKEAEAIEAVGQPPRGGALS